MQNRDLSKLIPSWLDGKSISRIQPMGYGDDTAQITPKEFVDSCTDNEISVLLGTCTGMVTTQSSSSDTGNNDDDDEMRTVTGVRYQPRLGTTGNDTADKEEEQILQADAVCVSAGPWSCQAEEWFDHSNIVCSNTATINSSNDAIKSLKLIMASSGLLLNLINIYSL